MKKLFFTFLTVSVITFSQTQTYFDSPFGGGGGFFSGAQFVNLKELNSKLNSISFPNFNNEVVFISGGGGYIYIGFIPQLRVGGLGYAGSKSISHSKNDVNYQLDYSLGVGGFTVEYTLPFVKDIAISLGAIIGGGEIEVEYYENSRSFSWTTVFTSSQKNNYTKLKNDFFLFSPTLSIDIPLYRFLALRFGLGYQFEIGGKWKANNDQTLFNVPESFNGNSFFINSSIYFGFFAF